MALNIVAVREDNQRLPADILDHSLGIGDGKIKISPQNKTNEILRFLRDYYREAIVLSFFKQVLDILDRHRVLSKNVKSFVSSAKLKQKKNK